MEGFKPTKSLIREIENIGLIVDPNSTFGSRLRETGVHYESSAPDWEPRTITTLLPIVYFYHVTPNGRKFLELERNLENQLCLVHQPPAELVMSIELEGF